MGDITESLFGQHVARGNRRQRFFDFVCRTFRRRRKTDAEEVLEHRESVNDQHDAFVFVGIKPAGLLRLLDLHSEIEQKSLRTTDVCHTILKPMTVPEGCTDNVNVTDAENLGLVRPQISPKLFPGHSSGQLPARNILLREYFTERP